MASARGILTAPPYRTPAQQSMLHARQYLTTGKAARQDAHTKVIKTATLLAQDLVERKHGAVTVKDITALTKTSGAARSEVEAIIDEAKVLFAKRAVQYVNQHQETVVSALANGDAKSLDVAARATQWALERIEHGGKRVIDKEQSAGGNGGTKVLIGINLGGKNPTYTEAETVDADPRS